jgi:hypothetical protein
MELAFAPVRIRIAALLVSWFLQVFFRNRF